MRFGVCFLLAVSTGCMGATLQLNSLALNPSLFNVTEFVTGVTDPAGMVQLSDGSIGVGTFDGIIRFTGPATTGTNIFPQPGIRLGLVQAGGYYIDSSYGNFTNGQSTPSITILKPGATADAPMTAVGSLQLTFPAGWYHDTPGIAVRPSPGKPGSYDLVFNVGAERGSIATLDNVQLSGLASATLDGDSLYAVTVDLSGAAPVASDVRKVASGIRNVVGMGFQPGTGDLYFADNAINGPGADADEPPQAEEIDRILAASFDNGAPPDFGFPNCYIQYRTGVTIGSGCIQPFFAIQPIPNGTALGSESEGVVQLSFAPANFPTGFNNGIFLAFSGKGDVTGPDNEENAVGYYDFGTGSYIHFSENSQNGVYEPVGLLATSDALYISDIDSGKVYEVTAAAPEPGTLALGALALGVLVLRRAFA